MKFLMGKAILDRHETRLDILHSLKHMKSHPNTLDRRMERIECHLGIPPIAGQSSTNPTTPIPVTWYDLDPL